MHKGSVRYKLVPTFSIDRNNQDGLTPVLVMRSVARRYSRLYGLRS